MPTCTVSRWPRPLKRRGSAVILSTFLLCSSTVALASSPGPAALFGTRCSGCHTYGKGIKVGPDLKGVTERRPRTWLRRFIRSSQSLIQAQEQTAMQLFRQFNQQQMPDWSDLSESDIDHLIDYFAAGGPERKSPAERHAGTATAADIATGRLLFSGQRPLKYADQTCSSCHSVEGDPKLAGGGTLGPDLTMAYPKFQDKALTSFLKRPCLPTAASVTYLTEEELFALKAYLHASSSAGESRPEHGATTLMGLDPRNAGGVLAALRSIGERLQGSGRPKGARP